MMEKHYRISNNDKTLALLKIEVDDKYAKVFVKWFGKGEWEEDIDAVGLLVGEHGIVEAL